MSLFNRRKKPIIVTIHGFGRNLSHEFDSLARYLKAKKYEVIQFDMYDLNNPNDANYKDWVQRCEAKLGLAIKENPNVIQIGFSMGGVIASYLASIYKVQSLILCAPAFEYLDIKKVTGLFKKSDKGILSREIFTGAGPPRPSTAYDTSTCDRSPDFTFRAST